MSSRTRVQAAGKRVGVNPSGPRIVCPACSGVGGVHDANGKWQMWLVLRRVAACRATFAAERGRPPPEPFNQPEPDEPLLVCGLCRGVGETSEAAARERAAAYGGRDVVMERIEAIKAYFARFPGPAPDTDADSPTPHATPGVA